MLSFRPELGSPGEYIFPLGYMINAYELNDPVVKNPYAIYILHLRIKAVNPMQNENPKGFPDQSYLHFLFYGLANICGLYEMHTLTHVLQYTGTLPPKHLPPSNFSQLKHAHKETDNMGFVSRSTGMVLFRDSVVILSKCLLFSITVEYCIQYVQLILKRLGHDMNIFLKPIILNRYFLNMHGWFLTLLLK